MQLLLYTIKSFSFTEGNVSPGKCKKILIIEVKSGVKKGFLKVQGCTGEEILKSHKLTRLDIKS